MNHDNMRANYQILTLRVLVKDFELNLLEYDTRNAEHWVNAVKLIQMRISFFMVNVLISASFKMFG